MSNVQYLNAKKVAMKVRLETEATFLEDMITRDQDRLATIRELLSWIEIDAEEERNEDPSA